MSSSFVDENEPWNRCRRRLSVGVRMCACPDQEGTNKDRKKMLKSKKKTNLEKNVKEGDCGLTVGPLEGELQFIW